jgi:hypothetical protein
MRSRRLGRAGAACRTGELRRSTVDAEEIVRERRMALGHLVEAAAYGDLMLQMFLCVLIGGEGGATAAAGRMAADMIKACAKLVREHERFGPAARQEALSLFEAYRAAHERRNRVVHDFGAGSGGVQIRSRRGQGELVSRPAATVADVRAAAAEIEWCWKGLVRLMFDVFDGAEALAPCFRIVTEA